MAPVSKKMWRPYNFTYEYIFTTHRKSAIILFWYLGNWDKGGPNSITHDRTDPRRKRGNTYLKNMN